MNYDYLTLSEILTRHIGGVEKEINKDKNLSMDDFIMKFQSYEKSKKGGDDSSSDDGVVELTSSESSSDSSSESSSGIIELEEISEVETEKRPSTLFDEDIEQINILIKDYTDKNDE